MKKEIESAEKDKPVLDEQTLARLLEAAYVLQEHNRELQEMELGFALKRDEIEAEARAIVTPPHNPAQTPEAEPAQTDYTITLGQIVETQHQIQVRHLELQSAITLVAERVTEIARASGASIGLLRGKKVKYRAGAGQMTLPEGTEVPMEKALCVACLRTGQVVRCEDVNPEFLLDSEECRRRGIQSLIAVPVFHDGEVAGGLELYYPRTHAFSEQDVHTCQLMAGLVTEALARDEEVTWKKSMASERAVMLEALEKLKPNLAALVDKTAAKNTPPKAGSPPAAASPVPYECRKCGHRLMGEEQFCGNCGSPRSADYEPPSMQSKVASLWHMQEAMKKNQPADPENGDFPQQRGQPDLGPMEPEKALADSIEEEAPELFAPHKRQDDSTSEASQMPAELVGEEIADPVESHPAESAEVVSEDDAGEAEATALAKRPADWSSAAAARAFLEQIANTKRAGGLSHFWQTRRGDIYLAIAVVLVAGVIRWGVWSNPSAGGTEQPAAAGQKKVAPDADLSFFDRMLLKLGLAEAPAAPEYKGNPDTQVWVDLHTALYYCPGADLYGKTPKGKFASQRDAQLDQFEPASRKACD